MEFEVLPLLKVSGTSRRVVDLVLRRPLSINRLYRLTDKGPGLGERPGGLRTILRRKVFRRRGEEDRF